MSRKVLLMQVFQKPSPIQLKAIPLGRCGLDLIVQAKSGTGKTCVFTVIALESLQLESSAVQVLVLAPTREIAIQIWEVIRSIGSAMPALRCHTFIGGMPFPEDVQKLNLCHIAVGTPGRIKQLIENRIMKIDSIRLFVLDEADKLLEESFQDQINWIYSSLPDNKQMLALSATYPEYLARHLTMYMRNPTFLRLNVTDPALLGIKQYFLCVPYHPLPNKTFDEKIRVVTHLLSSVNFHQCLVFSNLQTRAENLADVLVSQGWPTTCIAGSYEQKDRNQAMAKLKAYKCRVLISTDLTSRGIDAERVNLVVNLDVPKSHETYLHRVGRAGRFGTFGAAVTIVSRGQEELDLQSLEKKCNTHIMPLPEHLPPDLCQGTSPANLSDMVSTERIVSTPILPKIDEDGDSTKIRCNINTTRKQVSIADIEEKSEEANSENKSKHTEDKTDVTTQLTSLLSNFDVLTISEDSSNRKRDSKVGEKSVMNSEVPLCSGVNVETKKYDSVKTIALTKVELRPTLQSPMQEKINGVKTNGANGENIQFGKTKKMLRDTNASNTANEQEDQEILKKSISHCQTVREDEKSMSNGGEICALEPSNKNENESKRLQKCDKTSEHDQSVMSTSNIQILIPPFSETIQYQTLQSPHMYATVMNNYKEFLKKGEEQEEIQPKVPERDDRFSQERQSISQQIAILLDSYHDGRDQEILNPVDVRVRGENSEHNETVGKTDEIFHSHMQDPKSTNRANGKKKKTGKKNRSKAEIKITTLGNEKFASSKEIVGKLNATGSNITNTKESKIRSNSETDPQKVLCNNNTIQYSSIDTSDVTVTEETESDNEMSSSSMKQQKQGKKKLASPRQRNTYNPTYFPPRKFQQCKDFVESQNENFLQNSYENPNSLSLSNVGVSGVQSENNPYGYGNPNAWTANEDPSDQSDCNPFPYGNPSAFQQEHPRFSQEYNNASRNNASFNTYPRMDQAYYRQWNNEADPYYSNPIFNNNGYSNYCPTGAFGTPMWNYYYQMQYYNAWVRNQLDEQRNLHQKIQFKSQMQCQYIRMMLN
ncbi:hypothetical protein ScPMuIL_007428 [Solemya velum]